MDKTEKRMVFVWTLLVGLTVLSWESTSFAMGSVLVMVVAFFKVRLVMREFMEVRHAPRALAIVLDAWVIVTGLAIIGMMLLPLVCCQAMAAQPNSGTAKASAFLYTRPEGISIFIPIRIAARLPFTRLR